MKTSLQKRTIKKPALNLQIHRNRLLLKIPTVRIQKTVITAEVPEQGTTVGIQALTITKKLIKMMMVTVIPEKTIITEPMEI